MKPDPREAPTPPAEEEPAATATATAPIGGSAVPLPVASASAYRRCESRKRGGGGERWHGMTVHFPLFWCRRLPPSCLDGHSLTKIIFFCVFSVFPGPSLPFGRLETGRPGQRRRWKAPWTRWCLTAAAANRSGCRRLPLWRRGKCTSTVGGRSQTRGQSDPWLA